MTTAASCDCMVDNECQIDGADRLVRGSDYRGIVLENPADGTAFSFSPQRGTTSTIANRVQVRSVDGLQVRVVVKNTTGRIRLCSPSGSGNVGGYPVC
jgi:Tfp pilus assembly protein FimT